MAEEKTHRAFNYYFRCDCMWKNKTKHFWVEIQQFSNCFVSKNGTICPVGHNMISKTVKKQPNL